MVHLIEEHSVGSLVGKTYSSYHPPMPILAAQTIASAQVATALSDSMIQAVLVSEPEVLSLPSK